MICNKSNSQAFGTRYEANHEGWQYMNEELTRGREQVSRFLRARRNVTAAGDAAAVGDAVGDAVGAFHAARPESSMYERLFALQRKLHSEGGFLFTVTF